MKPNAYIAALLACTTVAVACGSTTGSSPLLGLPDATTQVCVPAEELPCACPSGPEGIKICNATGESFSTCICGLPGGSGSGSGTSLGSGSGTGTSPGGSGSGSGTNTGSGSGSGSGSSSGMDAGSGSGSSTARDAGHDAAPPPDPTTCTAAAALKSYVGCEFWPTVTANLVWDGFDFAAVVANTQSVAATVTVTGPNAFSSTSTVPANGLTPIYLPWVESLKGPDVTAVDMTFANSITATASAYHLISSIPVTVYQFSALEYQGIGGPPGKDWSACPDLSGTGCFSYSNDASILFPVAAMTGNYRVTSEHSSSLLGGGTLTITGTTNATSVTVSLSSTASVTASLAGDIAATSANGTIEFELNAGDVVELVGTADDTVDLGGSLVTATNPVQVITGRQCANQPDPMAACDHLESSVLPAETLGQHYVVTVPTSPHQTVVGHMVRFFGNVDGTVLTYSPAQPPGCPSTLNAGQVVECTGTPNCATGTANDGTEDPLPVTCVTQSFEVTGTHEFAVSSFMLGGSAVDPTDTTADQEGDPSMSPIVPVEEYRAKYVFLAPSDYEESYVDIAAPPTATLTLDGNPLLTPPTVLNSNWSIIRVALGLGQNGAHVLTGTQGFAAQVIGYGSYTSYQYPAGFDLTHIAAPPHRPPPRP